MNAERELAALGQTELNWHSREDRDVRDILLAFERALRARYQADMAWAQRVQGERRFLRAPDGFGGEMRAMVHPASFHYWGQRLGYKCWDDTGFLREYLRDNPEARVKNHGNIIVGPSGKPVNQRN